MTHRTLCVLACLPITAGGLVSAQTSTNININLVFGNPDGNPFTISNDLFLGQTGSVGSLGYAALVITSFSTPNFNAGPAGPAQVTLELAFNEIDTVAISFTESDPNFAFGTTVTMSGGTITGGTGAYAGATGSLDLTIVKDSADAAWTTTGSGTLTVGGKTTPLTLTNFRGWCCSWPTREEDYFSTSLTVSGSLGTGTGTHIAYYYLNAPSQVTGTATINFNSTDTLTVGYFYALPANSTTFGPPSSNFNGYIVSGTGKYANASGALNWTTTGSGLKFTGAMTTAPGAVITQIKTIYGAPQVAFNTWLEIHGHNLVPADTPSAGVDWSNAPEFANGQMPTQLGPVGVTFSAVNIPGYIYWYCSAQTNPNCGDDQINVLAPLLGVSDPAPFPVSVLNNGVPIASSAAFRASFSPAFLSFDAMGHIAARHLDSSLVGPASLYPGSSTPAKAGETISLYGTGFGPPSTMLVPGSSSQSGTIPGQLSCWVSGINAQAMGALVSPGLYQINLTIPKGVPSGDNPVVCVYAFYPTFPGALIAVQ